MAQQVYFIYNSVEPFPGYLLHNWCGRIDPDVDSDLRNRLEAHIQTDANLNLVYMQGFCFPNPETQKYDATGGVIVNLEAGDITPAAAHKSEVSGLYDNMKDLVENTSYTEVSGIVNNLFPDPDFTAGQRNFFKKIAYLALHHGKQQIRRA